MTIAIELAGEIALVTGGSRGVGRGIATRLLDAGATVVICGRNEPETLPTSTDGTRRTEPFRVVDVRDPEAVDALVADIVGSYGSIDIVVNNAGGTPVVPAAEASAGYSTKVVTLNLLAALYVSTAAYRYMTDQPHGGSIVNITSLSGTRPSPGSAAYGAAKAGLANLTTSLAMEWAPRVRVNAVTAGMVRTEMFDDYYGGAEQSAAVEATVPMGRAASPVEVGDAVVFLVSPLAGYVTGAEVLVHGGGEKLAFNELH